MIIINGYTNTLYDIYVNKFINKGISLGYPPLSYDIKIQLREIVKLYIKFGLWDKFYAIYPFIGSHVGWCSLNLRDPDKHKISFDGINSASIIYDEEGVTFTGSQSWGNTNFNIGTIKQNNFGYGVYSKKNSGTEIKGYDIGIEDTSAGIISSYLGASVTSDVYQTFWGGNIGTVNNSSGGFDAFYHMYGNISLLDTTKTDHIKFLNRNLVYSINNAAVAVSNLIIFIGALNSNGAAAYYTNRVIGYAFISQGLTLPNAVKHAIIVEEINKITNR